MTGVVISGDTGRGGVSAGPKAQPAPGQYKQVAAGVAARLADAWNKGDARAFGALFGEKADFIAMGGGLISGKDKIQAAHESLFKEAGGKTKSEFRLLKVKPLAPDVVAALYAQRLSSTGGKGAAVRTRPTAILRRVGQEWKIVLYQVTRLANGAGAGQAAAAKPAAAAKAAPATAAKPAAKAASAKKPAKGK
ncbi:MAG TPA: SgcJ/EcaC family oxidoreductase [Reyranella sp.]|nr:SgcJ/EcaC family oxidoreductase [Reyranella sp.]